MRNNIKNEQGITMVELLATLVLVSLIGALAYSILFQGFSNYQRVQAETELRDEADIIMSTLAKDLFTAKRTEVVLSNSCSANGYTTSTLTISKPNQPKKYIAFKPASASGEKGMVTINNTPIHLSNNVSLALERCTAGATASSPFNVRTKDQVSYNVKFKLLAEKNRTRHYKDFENTFNLINN